DVCDFHIWAPLQNQLKILIDDQKEAVPMQQLEKGYWSLQAEQVKPGTRYQYHLDSGENRPDPASFFQPEGVHGPSEVVDHHSHTWKDGSWQNIPLEQYIIYEMHTGTFSPQGTFTGVREKLTVLKELGITAIELMPVAQFPGSRNWGYDGAHPFAVQNSYGGPQALKQLVDEAHALGLAVILDVVYNHMGPEGNYLGEYGHYYTGKYNTPWGKALNFDDAYSDEVRYYFIQNALYWMRHFHIDALRLDAVHAICDLGAKHFLAELAEAKAELSAETGRPFYLIAESNQNDPRMVTRLEKNGWGMDAQWSDDFHHCFHTVLSGELSGYYMDYGQPKQIQKVFEESFVYSGDYSPFRKCRYGRSAKGFPPSQFVVSVQNHDQTGNRMLGERLISLTSPEAARLAAGAMLLSSYLPMLFMGEEYAESAPFLYFISHGDKGLVKAVQEGRREEFNSFLWQGDPPDPQSTDTFEKCKLGWEQYKQPGPQAMFAYYKKLISLRKNLPHFLGKDFSRVHTTMQRSHVLTVTRGNLPRAVVLIMNLSDTAQTYVIDDFSGTAKVMIDSSDTWWGGDGKTLPQSILPGQNINLPAWHFSALQLKEES
ncbi:MAG: malto-oligosyltrehalose trehalohydrolase, partial [Fibrobacteria bacterium]|nr:malto-oligosyltrehalose trehalohydrolase [Fibrobacteria bacterium]